MGISRQTFGNIIGRARHKVASALLGGQALKINQPGQEADADGAPGSCCQTCGKA
jgi:predicted DNA-binding protein (UPF0251 family)